MRKNIANFFANNFSKLTCVFSVFYISHQSFKCKKGFHKMFNKFLQTFFTLGITVFCNIAQLDFCKFTNFADSEKKEKWKKLEIVNQILFLYSLIVYCLNQYTFRCLEPLVLASFLILWLSVILLIFLILQTLIL